MIQDLLNKYNLTENEPMSKHTSFKTGGVADFLVKIENQEELKYVLEYAKQNNIPLILLFVALLMMIILLLNRNRELLGEIGTD